MNITEVNELKTALILLTKVVYRIENDIKELKQIINKNNEQKIAPKRKSVFENITNIQNAISNTNNRLTRKKHYLKKLIKNNSMSSDDENYEEEKDKDPTESIVPLKRKKLSYDSDLKVNVLYKIDEKCINAIKTCNPVIYLKKLDPSSKNLIDKSNNNKPVTYSRVQKAKKTKVNTNTPKSLPVVNRTKAALEISENYDISDLHSNCETDNEDNPKKTIPAWASYPYLLDTAKKQAKLNINFEKLFRTSANTDITITYQSTRSES